MLLHVTNYIHLTIELLRKITKVMEVGGLTNQVREFSLKELNYIL